MSDEETAATFADVGTDGNGPIDLRELKRMLRRSRSQSPNLAQREAEKAKGEVEVEVEVEVVEAADALDASPSLVVGTWSTNTTAALRHSHDGTADATAAAASAAAAAATSAPSPPTLESPPPPPPPPPPPHQALEHVPEASLPRASSADQLPSLDAAYPHSNSVFLRSCEGSCGEIEGQGASHHGATLHASTPGPAAAVASAAAALANGTAIHTANGIHTALANGTTTPARAAAQHGTSSARTRSASASASASASGSVDSRGTLPTRDHGRCSGGAHGGAKSRAAFGAAFGVAAAAAPPAMLTSASFHTDRARPFTPAMLTSASFLPPPTRRLSSVISFADGISFVDSLRSAAPPPEPRAGASPGRRASLAQQFGDGRVRAIDIMRDVDTDGDGVISARELKSALKASGMTDEETAATFADVGTNGNGPIDLRELKRMLRASSSPPRRSPRRASSSPPRRSPWRWSQPSPPRSPQRTRPPPPPPRPPAAAAAAAASAAVSAAAPPPPVPPPIGLDGQSGNGQSGYGQSGNGQSGQCAALTTTATTMAAETSALSAMMSAPALLTPPPPAGEWSALQALQERLRVHAQQQREASGAAAKGFTTAFGAALGAAPGAVSGAAPDVASSAVSSAVSNGAHSLGVCRQQGMASQLGTVPPLRQLPIPDTSSVWSRIAWEMGPALERARTASIGAAPAGAGP